MPIDLEKIEESPHLLDLLLFCEDVLDSLDIYVYRNWFDGEVVDGPRVGRHWVSISLLYSLDKMPDPRACLRLLKHGIRVEYSKVEREPDSHSDTGSHSGQASPLTHAGPHPETKGATTALGAEMASADAEMASADTGSDPAKPMQGRTAKVEKDWMVKVIFPRRLLDQMAAEDLNMYEDEVDEDDIESAKDSGMNDESAYEDDGQPPSETEEGPDAMGQEGDPAMVPPGGQP